MKPDHQITSSLLSLSLNSIYFPVLDDNKCRRFPFFSDQRKKNKKQLIVVIACVSAQKILFTRVPLFLSTE